MKRFDVFRFDVNNKEINIPYLMSYYIDTKTTGPMVLDVLLKIKN